MGSTARHAIFLGIEKGIKNTLIVLLWIKYVSLDETRQLSHHADNSCSHLVVRNQQFFTFVFSLPPAYLICATPFWGDETGRSSLLCEGQRRSFGLIYGQHLCCLFDCRRSSARRLQMAPLREKRVALCSRFMKISSLFRNILRQPLTMFVSNGSLLYQKMKKRLDEMWN